MLNLDLRERYLTDATGNRVAVVLELPVWEQVLAQLQMLDVRQRAALALADLRAEAKTRGLDRLTETGIAADIAAARAERHSERDEG